MKLESLENFQPIQNLVVCKRISDNANYITPAGIQPVSPLYNKDQYLFQNADRVFQVIKLPLRLSMRNGDFAGYNFGMEWDTDLDIEVGDVVFVCYEDSINAEEVEVGADKYKLIHYSRMYLRKRGDEYQALNGYIVYKEVHDKPKNEFDVMANQRILPKYGEVVLSSVPNRGYRRFKKEGGEAIFDLDGDMELEIGDVFIKTDPRNAVTLEKKPFLFYKDFETFVIQRRNILCVI